MAAVKFNLTVALSSRAVSAQGTNPQHAVETLDSVVGRLPRRFMCAAYLARIGAARLMPLRAISPQET
jgi:hypothetical protein